jgi:signal transduction histidine kinase
LASKRITAKSLIHPMLPQIHADRDQIKQVLLNLFQNGIEAMGEGGTITIAAFESQAPRERGVTVDVSDTGGGIAPQDIPHVFKPFFTSGKHRGTGLGLAICRNIIEAHSGDIQINSQVGTGTTVRIWLPIRQQPKINVS